MSEAFHEKLVFALKALSLSRGTLAAGLGVDKSLIGRWATGAVKPSAHNLSRLSNYVAQRVPGFTALDWERSLSSLAATLGVAPQGVESGPAADGGQTKGSIGLPFPLLTESLATTARRGVAYEGFFRTTRPFAQMSGRFIHDQVMIRRDENGHLRFQMTAGGVLVEGWVWLMHNQLFVVSAELTSGAFGFAILNGVSAVQADVFDGIILSCALDPTRTPTASAVLIERNGFLSGDREADDARFAEMAKAEYVSPEHAIAADVVQHLTRDVGIPQLGAIADGLLRMPMARSMARGADTAPASR